MGKYPEILNNWVSWRVMFFFYTCVLWFDWKYLKLNWEKIHFLLYLLGDPFLSGFQFYRIIPFKSVEFPNLLHLGQDRIVTIKLEQHFPVSYLSYTCLVKIECFYSCVASHEKELKTKYNYSKIRMLGCSFNVFNGKRTCCKWYFLYMIAILRRHYFDVLEKFLKLFHLGRKNFWTATWRFTKSLLFHPEWRVVHTWAR